MTTLQIQARALGEPSRHRLFEILSNADEPTTVAALTEAVGLHHNAVRQHLAVLVEAGLVREQTAAPSGPGRPRFTYELAPAADSRWGALGPYERLSMMLTEVIRTGDSPVGVGRRLALAAQTGTDRSATGLTMLLDDLERSGFAPTDSIRGRSVTITLHECPFASAALTDPDVVCDLHLGLAQGTAEAAGGLTVDSLTRKDPRRAGCRLHCTAD